VVQATWREAERVLHSQQTDEEAQLVKMVANATEQTVLHRVLELERLAFLGDMTDSSKSPHQVVVIPVIS
jgi:hypothetical protein